MNLTWLNNGFICKDLCAPFVLEKDSEYFDDLKRKYKIVIQQARVAGADDESIKILRTFKNKILEVMTFDRASRFFERVINKRVLRTKDE